MTTTNEILERRLGLALDFQGSLAADLKQMRAWRNKWRTRTQEWREKSREAVTAMRALRSELAEAHAQVAALTEENAKTREAYRVAFASELGAERARFTSALDKATSACDAATKRADLAEATLESVRAAVVKPAEDKQDVRPKVGDIVPWSAVEVGCLYTVDGYGAYPFRVVSRHTTTLSCGDDDRELEMYLDGTYKGTPIERLADFHEGQTHTTLIARDLGSDPGAWRAAMREYSAKVGK